MSAKELLCQHWYMPMWKSTQGKHSLPTFCLFNISAEVTWPPWCTDVKSHTFCLPKETLNIKCNHKLHMTEHRQTGSLHKCTSVAAPESDGCTRFNRYIAIGPTALGYC